MALTDAKIRAAKPQDKDWKLFDEKGLYLLVTKHGSKLWRQKFRFNGKEKKLSLGAYPEISLKDARQIRDEAKRDVSLGVDPARRKKEEKLAAKQGAEDSFESIAEEYILKCRKEGYAEATLDKSVWALKELGAGIGKLPIADVTPQELLRVLKRIESEGKREKANRIRSFASRVFRYGIATARIDVDPAHALRGALATPIVQHYSAITDKKRFGELLRAIEDYSGEPTTMAALKLTPHIFQRPGEVRGMCWSEVDLEQSVWTIPAARMKQRQGDHSVPLSRQACTLIGAMKHISGHTDYVFPSARSKLRPMSNNAMNGALRRLGYSKEEMTAHGFRTSASSLLNESGLWNPDAIERALSHKDHNPIRGIYNRSAYWDERVKMAQWWSDYLDMLRDGAEVLQFNKPKFG